MLLLSIVKYHGFYYSLLHSIGHNYGKELFFICWILNIYYYTIMCLLILNILYRVFLFCKVILQI